MCDRVDMKNEKIYNLVKENGCFDETIIANKCLEEYKRDFRKCQIEFVDLSNCKKGIKNINKQLNFNSN